MMRERRKTVAVITDTTHMGLTTWKIIFGTACGSLTEREEKMPTGQGKHCPQPGEISGVKAAAENAGMCRGARRGVGTQQTLKHHLSEALFLSLGKAADALVSARLICQKICCCA